MILRSRWLAPFVLCVTLSGSVSCNVFMTSAKFDKKMLNYQCAFFMECYDDYFSFESRSECVEAFEDYGYFSGDYYEDCDFDKKAASKCLKGMKIMVNAGCDDYDEAYDRAEDKLDECSEVYDCSSALPRDTADTR